MEKYNVLFEYRTTVLQLVVEFLHKPRTDSLCAIGTQVESILLNIHHITLLYGVILSLTMRMDELDDLL
jgi:hypothetical protein